jgi:hypothetical protein
MHFRENSLKIRKKTFFAPPIDLSFFETTSIALFQVQIQTSSCLVHYFPQGVGRLEQKLTITRIEFLCSLFKITRNKIGTRLDQQLQTRKGREAHAIVHKPKVKPSTGLVIWSTLFGKLQNQDPSVTVQAQRLLSCVVTQPL